ARASPSTLSPDTDGPAACQVPGVSAKIPATPGRPQLAATSAVLPLNAAAVSPVTWQARPGGVAFRELTVASRVHVVPSRCPSSALVPPLVSATSWPFGPAASASAALARLAFS